MQPNLYRVGSPESSSLIQSLRFDPPVVFVGSAISIWNPSGMPTGQDFTASLYDALFDVSFPLSVEEQSILRQLFGEMPFEHLLEVCPDPEAAAALIINLYGKSDPNPIHQALADALCQGDINSIITTNYDCCIEAAFAGVARRPLQKVVTEDHLLRYQVVNNPAWYFKIHGSIEPGLEATAIRTLAEECLLPMWKRQFLRSLLENRSVVFLGYSGRDFELCPEIARIPIKQMVWITRSPSPPSINAEALLEEAGGKILFGDMNDLLKEWLAAKEAKLGNDPFLVRSAIKKHFTSDVLCAWRLAILNRIGAPTLALRTLNIDTNKIDPIAAQRQQAHAEVSAGRYLSAAHRFLKASAKEYKSRGRCIAADVLLDASDAYRIGGAMIRAWLSFAFARILACKQNRAKIFLKLALLLNTLYGFIPPDKFHKVRSWLREWLVSVLKQCSQEALATGNWLDFQQAGLIARRLKVPLSVLAEGDFYPPPDPNRGYKQLGYFLAHSMTILDDLIERPPESRPQAERLELERTFTEHLRLCSVLGIAPQSWKLLAAGRTCFTLDRKAEIDFIRSMLNAFRSCEYKRVMRRYWKRRFPFLRFAIEIRSDCL